jgi:hypothetical protein
MQSSSFYFIFCREGDNTIQYNTIQYNTRKKVRRRSKVKPKHRKLAAMHSKNKNFIFCAIMLLCIIRLHVASNSTSTGHITIMKWKFCMNRLDSIHGDPTSFFNARNETWIMPVTLSSHYGKDYQLLRKSERWYVPLRQNAWVIQYDYFIRSNFATRFKPVYLLPVETTLNDTAFNIKLCTNDQFRKSAFNLHYRLSSLALEMSSYKDGDPSHTFHMQDCTLSCPQKTA